MRLWSLAWSSVVAFPLITMGCAAKQPAKRPVVIPSHIIHVEFTKDCEPEKDGVVVWCDRVKVTTDGTVTYVDKKKGEKDMRKQ